jgi:hypothetical protein
MVGIAWRQSRTHISCSLQQYTEESNAKTGTKFERYG